MRRFTGIKIFAFLSNKISKSQKTCEFEVYTFIKKQKGAKTMNLQKAKIYHDGSHFIAIPKGAFPSGKGCKRCVVKPTEQQPPTT